MRKIFLLFLFAFIFSGVIYSQQMTDQQVIEYVKQATQSGQTQEQISRELLRRGVTQEQVLRIKSQYAVTNTTVEDLDNKSSQMRDRVVSIIESKDNSKDSLKVSDDRIFGHNLFHNKNLSFAPSSNLATPLNYKLGPGDEVIIDIWGTSQNTIRQRISPEGDIMVDNLGPVHLNGMTVEKANSYLQREFSKIYSGIGGNDPNSQIRLTLGDIRTIQINIMGEVAVPGTYNLSAFSTIFHALYSAGGVNKIGSLRCIQLVRNGKIIETVDVYEFIMKGKMNDGISLQEGDVIIVKPYISLVEVVGKVKRPMFYEMNSDETLATLIKYAGGFTGDAYSKSIRVIRNSGGYEHQMYNVDEAQYSNFVLNDGDFVSIDSILDRFENKVEINGAVYRAGLYQINSEMNTVKKLIEKAEGLREDAFLNRAILYRELDDFSNEIIAIDLNGVMKGTNADISLKKNDYLYIPSIYELKEEATISIYGEVINPGTYSYSNKMTIEDLIVLANGLTEAASTTKVSVVRRLKDAKSISYSKNLAATFSFDIKDGLVVGDNDFYLEPFDMVQIRRSPSYHNQRRVIIEGEVLFAGSYVLLNKNERISDLVKRAGGITPDAYLEGSRLIRKKNEEELMRDKNTLQFALRSEGKDSISIEDLSIKDTYNVAVNINKAIAKPGSNYDIILREGDNIFIPEYISTVKISGSVMYPNTVTWIDGENLKYYINMAGGYGNTAKKNKVYIVYSNGTVKRANKFSSKLIEPGCEIIVPKKPERTPVKLGDVVGLTSSTLGIAAMVITLINAFKKN